MPIVIALTGPKGSGKDRVAEIIKENLGSLYSVKNIAFADPIKKAVQHIFCLSPHDVNEYDNIKRTDLRWNPMCSVPGRHVVREIGMLMRDYDTEQFVRYVEKEIKENSVPNSIWVVTDLRFDNEYTLLKKLSAVIVKVTRPNYYYDGHITERGFDDTLVDYVIDNNGTLKDLKQKVIETMKEVIKR